MRAGEKKSLERRIPATFFINGLCRLKRSQAKAHIPDRRLRKNRGRIAGVSARIATKAVLFLETGEGAGVCGKVQAPCERYEKAADILRYQRLEMVSEGLMPSGR